MKEKRLNSLSVKLCDSQENDLHEVADYLHHEIGIPNTKTAAIRHLIEEAHQQLCEDIVRLNED
jgi:signal transduction histidine kinase